MVVDDEMDHRLEVMVPVNKAEELNLLDPFITPSFFIPLLVDIELSGIEEGEVDVSFSGGKKEGLKDV